MRLLISILGPALSALIALQLTACQIQVDEDVDLNSVARCLDRFDDCRDMNRPACNTEYEVCRGGMFDAWEFVVARSGK